MSYCYVQKGLWEKSQGPFIFMKGGDGGMKWISVKDRLPDKKYLDCMLVLKVGDHYEIDCGGWTKAIGWEDGVQVEEWGWWVRNDWDEGQGCVVQYWMPYPKLPKEIREKLVSGYGENKI